MGSGQALRFEGDGASPVLDMSNKWGETGADQKGNLYIVYAFTSKSDFD